MSGKKKVPKVRRMDRKRRLRHARATDWVNQNGDVTNLEQCYRQYFGVDAYSAAFELRQLGVPLSEAYCESVKRASYPASAARNQEDFDESWTDYGGRCWPVWRDEPFPFPVDDGEITFLDDPEELDQWLTDEDPERPRSEEEWAAIMQTEAAGISTRPWWDEREWQSQDDPVATEEEWAAIMETEDAECNVTPWWDEKDWHDVDDENPF